MATARAAPGRLVVVPLLRVLTVVLMRIHKGEQLCRNTPMPPTTRTQMSSRETGEIQISPVGRPKVRFLVLRLRHN